MRAESTATDVDAKRCSVRITPREPSQNEMRPLRRDERARASAPRRGRPDVQVDADGALPRAIARSQSLVAGLRQLRTAIERGESVDVGALVAAVRFDGEPVLSAHEKDLRQIVSSGDGARLGRLIDNTENNVLALLSRSGADVMQQLLSATERPAEMRALLDRTLAALGSRAAEASALRPERVIELLRESASAPRESGRSPA